VLRSTGKSDEAVAIGKTQFGVTPDNSLASYIISTYMIKKQYAEANAFAIEAEAILKTDYLRSTIAHTYMCLLQVTEGVNYAEAVYKATPGPLLAFRLVNLYYAAKKYAETVALGAPLFVSSQGEWYASRVGRTVMYAAQQIGNTQLAAETGAAVVKMLDIQCAPSLPTVVQLYVELNQTEPLKDVVETCAAKCPEAVLKIVSEQPLAYSTAAVVTAVENTDFEKVDTALPIAAFNAFPWSTGTPAEAVAFCNQLLMVTPVNERTAPFVAIVRDKKLAIQ